LYAYSRQAVPRAMPGRLAAARPKLRIHADHLAASAHRTQQSIHHGADPSALSGPAIDAGPDVTGRSTRGRLATRDFVRCDQAEAGSGRAFLSSTGNVRRHWVGEGCLVCRGWKSISDLGSGNLQDMP